MRELAIAVVVIVMILGGAWAVRDANRHAEDMRAGRSKDQAQRIREVDGQ